MKNIKRTAMTLYRCQIIIVLMLLLAVQGCKKASSNSPGNIPETTIQKTDDFEITGDGSADNWAKTDWIQLTQRNQPNNEQLTKAKVLYSNTGLYVLFQSKDSLVTTPFTADYEELWNGDVVEIFMWTNQSQPDYFEYEISPLDYELPLIVSNIDGELLHWIPFENSYHSENGRKVLHKTTVTNGHRENGASTDSWTAEIFIPFKLLHPLKNIYPESGTTWRANLYRIDYDDGETYWSWSPFEETFHEYENFGAFRFE